MESSSKLGYIESPHLVMISNRHLEHQSLLLRLLNMKIEIKGDLYPFLQKVANFSREVLSKKVFASIFLFDVSN
jgi:hypothetical protein